MQHAGRSVIDSYTGLPWCLAGLHMLEEGVNAHRRTKGLICLPCQARTKRERRRKKNRALAATPTNRRSPAA